MKVLIVGGAGYIGGALTDILLKTKHEIRVYDALLFEESYLKEVPFVFGDIRNKKHLQGHLKWANAVVWLAALVGDGACALNPEISTELNQDMVKWLAQNYNGRIIFMSTCSVYGEHVGILDENAPTNPLSVYAVTKLAAEDHLKNKNAIIFRLGTIFGLGDNFARIRLDLVLNTLTTRAIVDGRIKVFGGEQWRPLLHVRDAAQAVADNLETKHTGIYNLHQANVKIIDLAMGVKKYIPQVEMEIVDIKFQDARNYRVNSDKARKGFGFKPKYTSEDGIKEVKKLIEDHRIKDVNNPRYSNQNFLTMFKTHHYIDEDK
ncbi:MAG TPA: NAD(P)-dependent oxidoreductase [Candidatus Saccharimonadales bacterium]|nr:NAD(P)-dependent oxidoreductase [Candidatus Saccharimonadales bacterium]